MLKLFRRKKLTSALPIAGKILYTNCDIPARLFFDELCNGNLSVLGEGTPEELQAAYMSILDEYVDIDNNKSFLKAFQIEEQAADIQAKIAAIELAVYHIYYDPIITKEQRLEIISTLNEWKKPRIRFDPDKPTLDECYRLQTKVIGSLKNDLNFLLAERKTERKERVKTFYRDVAAIEVVLAPLRIDANVTLRMFLEYNKIAVEKTKPRK